MLLEDKFFVKIGFDCGYDHATFRVALIPDSDVYRGHFPGNPVVPGMCQVEMIRECLRYIMDARPTIKTIEKCRFIKVLHPGNDNKEMRIDCRFKRDDQGFHLQASLSDDSDKYLDLKATLA